MAARIGFVSEYSRSVSQSAPFAIRQIQYLPDIQIYTNCESAADVAATSCASFKTLNLLRFGATVSEAF